MDSVQKLTRQEFKTLAIIIVVGICGTLGIDIHLASLPRIMAFMHTNKAHMQQSVSIFLLGTGVSLLFYGPLSDRYGRKPIVIVGLAVAVVASYASAFTTHINPFLVTRLFQGIGSGVCLGLGRTMVADVLQGDRFASIGSYFSMFLALSPLLAPALGGYIQHWFGWQANFIVLGSFLTFAIILYGLFCPETNHYKNPDACRFSILFRNYKDLMMHPVFVGSTLLAGIAMASNMVYATTSSFILQQQFYLTPVDYGWLTALVGVGSFVGKLSNPQSIRLIGSQKTLLSGLVLLGIAGFWVLLFIMLHWINVSLIMIAVFATVFAQAFINPNAGARALTPFHDKRGAAGALYGCFQMLTAFLASAIAGSLAHDGVVVLAASYAVLGILGVGIYFWVFKA